MSDIPSRLTLRPVTLADAPRLSKLSQQTFCDTFGYLYSEDDLQQHLRSKRSAQAYAKLIAEAQEHLSFIVYDNEICGYLYYGSNTLPYDQAPATAVELKQFYLIKALQGKGLGSIVLNHALSLPELACAPAVYLGVWENNHGAQRLYARFGFEAVGTYSYLVGSHEDHEIIMQRLNDQA